MRYKSYHERKQRSVAEKQWRWSVRDFTASLRLGRSPFRDYPHPPNYWSAAPSGANAFEPLERDHLSMSYAITESADSQNLQMAKEIAQDLTMAFPGHSWHVRIDGGLLIIKNMNISVTASMVRHIKELDHDAGKRKHDVVMAAGEFLEAANMRRGAWREGEIAQSLEGLPKGHRHKKVDGSIQ